MIPISGAVSLSQVRTELGLAGAMSMEQIKVRRLAGKSSGAVSGSDLRGGTYIRSNVSSGLSLTQASGAARYRYVIDPAVWIYGVPGVSTEALTIGAHPAGSTVILDNYGIVVGHAGMSSGAGGREGVYVPWSGSVTINNYGFMYGGGGAGGQGGTGGQGGGGYYTSPVQEGDANTYSETYPRYSWATYVGDIDISWSNDLIYSGGGSASATSWGPIGGYTYYRGDLERTELVGKSGQYRYWYGVYRTYQQTYYTTGGAGGAGGDGGRGQDASGSWVIGWAGSNGYSGGTNAGTGGQGGTGGTGGEYGKQGQTGYAGNTGASGNYTSGSAGASGAAGGPPGYYLYRSAGHNCTFNNYGTATGRIQ